jgi:hypothetical protein
MREPCGRFYEQILKIPLIGECCPATKKEKLFCDKVWIKGGVCV